MDNGEQQLPGSSNLAFIEDLYQAYLNDSASVSEQWRAYFSGFSITKGAAEEASGSARFRVGPSFKARSVFNASGSQAQVSSNGNANDLADELQERVDQLVRSYRERGHLEAELDPLGIKRPPFRELDPEFHGLRPAHMDLQFSTQTIGGKMRRDRATLREIIGLMRTTYCRSIGAEFAHINDYEVRRWLIARMEGSGNRLDLDRQQQLRILKKLTEATVLEGFIQSKYLKDKRFSLEGGESLMPLLQLAFERAAEQGVEHVVIGMAHRGRLDVLANIIGMPPREIFREFEGTNPEYAFRHGDVKYHLGYSSDWQDDAGHKLSVSLCFNPSHLEYVNPVVQGRVRAVQDRIGDKQRKRALALMIHGDAAFAGEGISQETLNMANLKGYTVGGSVHVVINNQIGFTTGPDQGRSSTYCTGVAKLLQSPIFHVNGEDPEAVAQVIQMAMDFRNEFEQDVFVDMYCYRRWGHNEGDEPSFTQPQMYAAIKSRKSVRDSYLDHLLKLGGVSQEEADQMANSQRDWLEAEYNAAKEPVVSNSNGTYIVRHGQWHGGPWELAETADTGVDLDHLKYLLEVQTQLPSGFTPHAGLVKTTGPKHLWGPIAKRGEMAKGELPLDWGAAETLAYATLAAAGHSVRVSGQDAERGTFSHRHAVLHDFNTNELYVPLQHLSGDQALVEIHNSPLSEAGVMGFEYGYSVDMLNSLTVWEAQFGDFVNAGQVIIDQFLASAEDKWKYLSGLTLLLPHGFEGMGPEHSSARLERFLTAAAGDNIQVCNVTTPAQIFHLLRRQVLRNWRKPLIVMSPKSLLRHPDAVSSLETLSNGGFKNILPDDAGRDPKKVKQVLICSGKIYYELARSRTEMKRDDVAILRIEQLYPLSDKWLKDALSVYKAGTPVTWVQEEPENMGAWRYLLSRFGYEMFGSYPLTCVSRPASPSPATGSKKVHEREQAAMIEQAFGSELPKSGGKGLALTAVTKGFAS
jgi:2-oxoglutarate dehydrogenase E1 component